MSYGTVAGPPQQNIFRVEIQFELENAKCQTGFYLRDALLNDNDLQDVLDAVVPIADTQFRAMLMAPDLLTGVDVVRIFDKVGISHSFSSTAGSVAGGLDSTVPGFTACVLNLKGERRIKLGQGRMFLPVRFETWVTGSQVSNAGVAVINPFITAMTDAFIGNQLTGGLQLCNYHDAKPERPTTRKGQPGPNLPAVPASYYDVTSLRLNRTLTSLGSRKLGNGS